MTPDGWYITTEVTSTRRPVLRCPWVSHSVQCTQNLQRPVSPAYNVFYAPCPLRMSSTHSAHSVPQIECLLSAASFLHTVCPVDMWRGRRLKALVALKSKWENRTSHPETCHRTPSLGIPKGYPKGTSWGSTSVVHNSTVETCGYKCARTLVHASFLFRRKLRPASCIRLCTLNLEYSAGRAGG